MQASPESHRQGGPGSALVIALVGLAAALAVFAIWFQWNQTRRCLGFYGPAVARSVQAAPRVELWTLQVDATGRQVVAHDRLDVSDARGLVHLRRGLVEDANFAWQGAPVGRRPLREWDAALAFFAATPSGPPTILAFDLDGEGSVTVVGQPGHVQLGRLAKGLRQWLKATRDGESPSHSPR
jgi:hypothetical protein